MDRVTRCLHCGKRMIPAHSPTGRTELVYVFCDKLDPMEMVEPVKWADSLTRHSYFRDSPLSDTARWLF